MMYSINNIKHINKGGKINFNEVISIDGFLMGSSRKVFIINGFRIKRIKIVSKKLANPLVSRKVFKKYNKLVLLLTELLIDDDSGDSCREVLNQIEKFRLEIKNKYRRYLTKKDLETMSVKLVLLQKEANKKLIEIHNSYIESLNNSRSK